MHQHLSSVTAQVREELAEYRKEIEALRRDKKELFSAALNAEEKHIRALEVLKEERESWDKERAGQILREGLPGDTRGTK